jgi:hypothetical protein
MRYAIVQDTLVVNVILWDGVTLYPNDGLIELEEGSPVGIGWNLDNGEWVAPLEPEIEHPVV